VAQAPRRSARNGDHASDVNGHIRRHDCAKLKNAKAARRRFFKSGEWKHLAGSKNRLIAPAQFDLVAGSSLGSAGSGSGSIGNRASGSAGRVSSGAGGFGNGSSSRVGGSRSSTADFGSCRLNGVGSSAGSGFRSRCGRRRGLLGLAASGQRGSSNQGSQNKRLIHLNDPREKWKIFSGKLQDANDDQTRALSERKETLELFPLNLKL
jgi:hypothetical protein